MRAAVAAAIAFAGMASCTDATDRLADQTEVFARDSSGVSILELPHGVLEQLPVLSIDTPFVRIGVPEGDEQDQLFGVRGVRRLSDGTLLVLNAGTHELRRYGSNGTWLNSSGRRGGGPGEMQSPLFLVRGDADSSLVFDLTRRAFHIVDPQGDIVGSRSLSILPSGFVGLLDANIAVVADPAFPRSIYDRVLTAEVTLGTVDLDHGKIDTLLTLTGFQEYRYTHGELVRTVRVPFTTMPAVAVHEQQIYVTDGLIPEVRVYERDGVLRKIVRFDIAPAPVTAAEWERAAQEMIDSQAGTGRGEGRLTPAELRRQRQIVSEMPRPQTRPFFDRLHLEDGGNIWLRLFTPGGDAQRWVTVDSTGRPTASVLLPRRFRVREFNDSWVLGQDVDDLGVEYVVMYALIEST